MIVEILDPKYRYNLEKLTQKDLNILSAEIEPEDPEFWSSYILIPLYKDRVLEIRVNPDGSRSYFYTLPTQNENPILKLNSILYRIRKASFNYNKLKVEAGDYTNAKSLFAVNNIEFKNKRICII